MLNIILALMVVLASFGARAGGFGSSVSRGFSAPSTRTYSAPRVNSPSVSATASKPAPVVTPRPITVIKPNYLGPELVVPPPVRSTYIPPTNYSNNGMFWWWYWFFGVQNPPKYNGCYQVQYENGTYQECGQQKPTPKLDKLPNAAEINQELRK